MPVGEKKRLVFWQNLPSIHQAPLLRSLAEHWIGDVVVVVEHDVSHRRQAQGWGRPDFSPARLVISPSEAKRGRLLKESPEASLHIFSGFHAEPDTYATFKAAVQQQLDVGVFAEPARSGGVRGALRRVRYASHAFRWSHHLTFLLSTGTLGIDWYRRCGFSDRLLHPFAYFVDPVNYGIQRFENRSAAFRFLYVGQLAEHKGPDLLLSALAQLETNCWKLEVVGNGPLSDALHSLASSEGIEGRVRWHGMLSNAAVRSLMGEVDNLVLPSRYDGWGAVVNEALLAGTPAIVSDAAGSSDLIQGDLIGDVFRSESIERLKEALRARVTRGSLETSERTSIRKWAEEFISPEAGAEHLISVLRFLFNDEARSRPVPPWRRQRAVELASKRFEASDHI